MDTTNTVLERMFHIIYYSFKQATIQRFQSCRSQILSVEAEKETRSHDYVHLVGDRDGEARILIILAHESTIECCDNLTLLVYMFARAKMAESTGKILEGVFGEADSSPGTVANSCRNQP